LGGSPLKKWGYSALAAAFSVTGCSTEDVSVGTEGAAYNLTLRTWLYGICRNVAAAARRERHLRT
jgi:hypothetical protein